MKQLTRTSGILLHPTSCPGPYGIGDLGEVAYRFVDFLVEAGQSLWQILPLGPTGFGDSPYASSSSFAGNPLLISPDKLVEWGDLTPADLADRPDFSIDEVEYDRVIAWKFPLLRKAAGNFLAGADSTRRVDFENFCSDQAGWLDDFALFMVVKEIFDRQIRTEGNFDPITWNTHWDRDIAMRQPAAVKQWQQTHSEVISGQKVIQYYFFRQWVELRSYANQRGIKIIGDLPIYVAPDSADMWANQELFLLDKSGRPTFVAGVPPDYFDEDGQKWGNALYNWEVLAEKEYQWWVERMRATLAMVDIVRIDQFRALEAYWAIPSDETTDVGQWVKGPGEKLFHAFQTALGDDLPIIAEDLGTLTPAVISLRRKFGIPGMKFLQFAFQTDFTNPDMPFNHDHDYVIYTGNHDNNTTRGWYNDLSKEDQQKVRDYLGTDGHDISWDFIRLAMSSVADIAIIPFQDALNLGNEARMNTPGVQGGNWQWRYWPGALDDRLMIDRLRTLTEIYGRQGLTRDETGNLGDWMKGTKIPEPIIKFD